MSHNDVSVDLNLERDFGKFSLGVAPRVMYRLDTEDSRFYPNQAKSGVLQNKLRHDWDITLQGNVSVPLFPSLELYGWYEWRRVVSSIQSGDYLDRNYSDQIVGLGLKAILTTY